MKLMKEKSVGPFFYKEKTYGSITLSTSNIIYLKYLISSFVIFNMALAYGGTQLKCEIEPFLSDYFSSPGASFFRNYNCTTAAQIISAAKNTKEQEQEEERSNLTDINFYKGPKINLNGDRYIIFNHSNGGYDTTYSSKNGALKLQEISRAMNIPIIIASTFNFSPQTEQIEDEVEVPRYKDYIDPSFADVVLTSIGGDHNINFKKVTELIYAGGFLTQCLCESIRDSILNRDGYQEKIRISLVTDAIYVHQQMPSYFAMEFIKRQKGDLPVITLASFLKINNSFEFAKNYILEGIFGIDGITHKPSDKSLNTFESLARLHSNPLANNIKRPIFCPLQYKEFKSISLRNDYSDGYTIVLTYKGITKKIHQSGHNVIHLNLIETDSVGLNQ